VISFFIKNPVDQFILHRQSDNRALIGRRWLKVGGS